MIARFGARLSRFANRWVPDPLVLAFGLTLLVAGIGAWRLSGAPAGEDGIAATLALGWLTEMTKAPYLAFALQMCLVLVTGHAIAVSPPVQRAIRAIAAVPRNAPAASALVAVVACGSALIHWGLGAIAGALLAREIGRHASSRNLAVHYPILGAAAYSGMAVWHGGLSGSAPLKVAEGDAAAHGVELALGDMLLSPVNLVVTGTLIVGIPLLFWLMTPRDEGELVPPGDLSAGVPLEADEPGTGQGPAAALQRSPWVGRALGVAGVALVLWSILARDRKLDINSVNLLFLFAGVGLQGAIDSYVRAVASGARAAGAIIIQFPLYFGILGLMKASGMVQWLSDSLASSTSESSFPAVSFASAGLVNFFIPSGGGQWAVQKDILLGGGTELGVAPELTIMAFSYGDAWTNMLQPFWALPLLGLMGLKARDIIGYTAVLCLAMAIVVPVLLFAMG